MVTCCVPLCKSHSKSSNDKLSFHSFPKRNAELLQKWLAAIGRPGWTPKPRSYVCSRHFQESDYSISTTVRSLLPEKVPSVFEHSLGKRMRNRNLSRHEYEKIEEVTSTSSLKNEGSGELLFMDVGVQCSLSKPANCYEKYLQALTRQKEVIAKLKQRNKDLKLEIKKLENQEFSRRKNINSVDVSDVLNINANS